MATGSRRLAARWSAAAERDVGRIFAWLRERSPRAAAATVRRLVEVVDLLEEQPELGAVAEELEPAGSVRQFVVRPYRVLYDVRGEELRVIRVWDTRRDPATLRVPPEDER